MQDISAIVLTVPMGLLPTATTTPHAPPPTIIHTVVIRTPFLAATLTTFSTAHRAIMADAESIIR